MELNIAMVKDLLVDNIDGHVICFRDAVTRIAKPDHIDKKTCYWHACYFC